MTLVIPDGFGQAAYRFSLTGDPEVMISTIGVLWNDIGGTPQGTADDMRDQFSSVFGAADIIAGWSFLGVTLKAQDGGGLPGIFEAPANVVGTAAITSPPNNVTTLVKKITALGGRSGRGRMFLPPFNLNEASVANNGMISGVVLAAMQTGINSAIWAANRMLLHDSAAPGAPDPTPITSLIVDPQVATQRRRLR
jgi:hypothetical protein